LETGTERRKVGSERRDRNCLDTAPGSLFSLSLRSLRGDLYPPFQYGEEEEEEEEEVKVEKGGNGTDIDEESCCETDVPSANLWWIRCGC
jgi:hypothetical protein